MSEKPFAPATERNTRPILDVIRKEFRESASVLEIGSGTGQHAVHFAAELKHVTWQTSDVAGNHPGILLWLLDAGLPNVLDPVILDVLTDRPPNQNYDGVFSANTAHIMSVEAVEKMFRVAGSVLKEGGLFVLYGPLRQNGQFSTRSNAKFDRSLRAGDSAMGIRDLKDLDRFAKEGGMVRVRLYAMPANNNIAVWRKDERRIQK